MPGNLNKKSYICGYISLAEYNKPYINNNKPYIYNNKIKSKENFIEKKRVFSFYNNSPYYCRFSLELSNGETIYTDNFSPQEKSPLFKLPEDSSVIKGICSIYGTSEAIKVNTTFMQIKLGFITRFTLQNYTSSEPGLNLKLLFNIEPIPPEKPEEEDETRLGNNAQFIVINSTGNKQKDGSFTGILGNVEVTSGNNYLLYPSNLDPGTTTGKYQPIPNNTEIEGLICKFTITTGMLTDKSIELDIKKIIRGIRYKIYILVEPEDISQTPYFFVEEEKIILS